MPSVIEDNFVLDHDYQGEYGNHARQDGSGQHPVNDAVVPSSDQVVVVECAQIGTYACKNKQ